jgi:hypothetical protein
MCAWLDDAGECEGEGEKLRLSQKSDHLLGVARSESCAFLGFRSEFALTAATRDINVQAPQSPTTKTLLYKPQ